MSGAIRSTLSLSAPIAHVPAGTFRTVIDDGRARVHVADRRADRNGFDVRVRPVRTVTVRHAANAVAHRCEGWDRDTVLAFHGIDPDSDLSGPARGSLRTEYLAILAREGR